MNKQETEDKIKKALAENLRVDISRIIPQASLVNDLGADSFAAIELAYALEEGFGISISDQEMVALKTVEDVFKTIEQKLSAKD